MCARMRQTFFFLMGKVYWIAMKTRQRLAIYVSNIARREIHVVFFMGKFSSPSTMHFSRIFLSTLKRESAFLNLPFSCVIFFQLLSLQHSHIHLISFLTLCDVAVAYSDIMYNHSFKLHF